MWLSDKIGYVYSANAERNSLLPLCIGKVFLASIVNWIYLVFFGGKKKTTLLTCGLGHMLLGEETPLYILLCISDVGLYGTSNRRCSLIFKKWRIRVLDIDRHSNADTK